MGTECGKRIIRDPKHTKPYNIDTQAGEDISFNVVFKIKNDADINTGIDYSTSTYLRLSNGGRANLMSIDTEIISAADAAKEIVEQHLPELTWVSASSYSTKGLYAYNEESTTYANKAYFGTGGSNTQQLTTLTSPKYRPWHEIISRYYKVTAKFKYTIGETDMSALSSTPLQITELVGKIYAVSNNSVAFENVLWSRLTTKNLPTSTDNIIELIKHKYDKDGDGHLTIDEMESFITTHILDPAQ